MVVDRGLGAGEDVSQGDQPALGVGYLDADRRLARYRDQDPDVRGGQGVGDVVGEARHPIHLDPGRQLDLEPGDGGTGHDLGQGGIDTMLDQCLFQLTGGVLEGALVDLPAGAFVEQAERRQFVAGVGEVHGLDHRCRDHGALGRFLRLLGRRPRRLGALVTAPARLRRLDHPVLDVGGAGRRTGHESGAGQSTGRLEDVGDTQGQVADTGLGHDQHPHPHRRCQDHEGPPDTEDATQRERDQ